MRPARASRCRSPAIPQHYPPRIHLDLYADDQAAEIAAAAGPRRPRGGLGRLPRRRGLGRARGHRGQPVLRRGHRSAGDRLSAVSAARRPPARIASRSGLPLGSVARSSTSTSRVGRACGPISLDDRLARLLRAGPTRCGAAPRRGARRRRMPRPSAASGSPTTTADSSPGIARTMRSTRSSETLMPPETMTLSMRPRTRRTSSSMIPASPVRYQRVPSSSCDGRRHPSPRRRPR